MKIYIESNAKDCTEYGKQIDELKNRLGIAKHSRSECWFEFRQVHRCHHKAVERTTCDLNRHDAAPNRSNRTNHVNRCSSIIRIRRRSFRWKITATANSWNRIWNWCERWVHWSSMPKTCERPSMYWRPRTNLYRTFTTKSVTWIIVPNLP